MPSESDRLSQKLIILEWNYLEHLKFEREMSFYPVDDPKRKQMREAALSIMAEINQIRNRK